jgi:hypothetical protein
MMTAAMSHRRATLEDCAAPSRSPLAAAFAERQPKYTATSPRGRKQHAVAAMARPRYVGGASPTGFKAVAGCSMDIATQTTGDPPVSRPGSSPTAAPPRPSFHPATGTWCRNGAQTAEIRPVLPLDGTNGDKGAARRWRVARDPLRAGSRPRARQSRRAARPRRRSFVASGTCGSRQGGSHRTIPGSTPRRSFPLW